MDKTNAHSLDFYYSVTRFMKSSNICGVLEENCLVVKAKATRAIPSLFIARVPTRCSSREKIKGSLVVRNQLPGGKLKTSVIVGCFF